MTTAKSPKCPAAPQLFGAAAMLSLAGSLGGCGGAASSGASAPVAVAPAPVPVPAPTPAPSPTPTPGSVRFVGASPGESLIGLEACARNEVTRDSQGRVTAIPSLSGAKIDNSIALTYRGIDSFALDVNGFGGSTFTAADKKASPTLVYDRFSSAVQGEFLIFRNSAFGSQTFATLGLDNTSGLCFFAVGLPIDTFPTGTIVKYDGRIDGIGRNDGLTTRLFGSQGTIQLFTQNRVADVELKLVGRGDPFGDFTAQPLRDLTLAKASLQLQANGIFSTGTLTGSNGYSGTITGMLVSRRADSVCGGGGAGAVFTFEMTNAKGDVLFGAVAAEQNCI